MSVKYDIDWDGAQVDRAVKSAVADSILVACEFVLGESNQVVPLELGDLERSGTATVDEADLKGAISYDTPYAARQHEDLTFRHAPGRSAKFLELALKRNRRKVGKIIATQVRRRTGA